PRETSQQAGTDMTGRVTTRRRSVGAALRAVAANSLDETREVGIGRARVGEDGPSWVSAYVLPGRSQEKYRCRSLLFEGHPAGCFEVALHRSLVACLR